MFYINDEIDGDDNTIMIQVGVTWTWPIGQTSGNINKNTGSVSSGLEDFLENITSNNERLLLRQTFHI